MFAYEYARNSSLSILCSINIPFDPIRPHVLNEEGKHCRGAIQVGNGAVRRLLVSLEGNFEAGLEAEIDAAADDLAFSLAQDVPLTHEILRSGASVLIGDGEAPVTAIGHDYVAAGQWLVPLAAAVVRLGGSPRPIAEPDVFLVRLRRLARGRDGVAVGRRGTSQTFEGYIERANATHLVVTGVARWLLPIAEVAYVRRARGGSADGP